jgi:arsenate reductase (glutaredoxin)
MWDGRGGRVAKAARLFPWNGGGKPVLTGVCVASGAGAGSKCASSFPHWEHAVAITIYHNAACSTSRKVLAAIREKGGEPEIVEYLRTPPSVSKIKELLKGLGMSPRELIRKKGNLYTELDLENPKWTDAQLIAFMAEHPALIERPIVVSDKGTRLGRPAEKVLEIL